MVPFLNIGWWNANEQTWWRHRYLHFDQEIVFIWPLRSSKLEELHPQDGAPLSNPLRAVSKSGKTFDPCQRHKWMVHYLEGHPHCGDWSLEMVQVKWVVPCLPSFWWHLKLDPFHFEAIGEWWFLRYFASPFLF